MRISVSIILGFGLVAVAIFASAIIAPASAQFDQYDYAMLRDGLADIANAIYSIESCR